jgi:MFS family permease
MRFTALSHSYALTLVARFIAGVSAGLIWALLAGYAARMVPEHRKGAAIAVAMAGTPLALSLRARGDVARHVDRLARGLCVMSVFAVALLVWVRAIVLDFAGQTQEKTRGKMQEKTQTRRPASRSALSLPGVRAVLLVVLDIRARAQSALHVYRVISQRRVWAIRPIVSC